MKLTDLVPVTYDDYLSKMTREIPFVDFINPDLVFRDLNSDKFYLFEKNGVWNESEVSKDEFDFRNLYKEFDWLDKHLLTN